MRNILQNIGLGENESKTYLALLQIGEGSILDISKHCDLKRPTVYSAVELLLTKGIVTQSLIGKRKRFHPKPPAELLNLLRQKEREFSAALPQLEAIANVPRVTKPITRYYEGVHPVTSLYKRIMSEIKEGSIMYTAASIQDMLSRFPTIVDTFDELVYKWKWSVKELVPKNKSTEEYISHPARPASQNQRHQFKYLPNALNLYDVDFMIVNDMVVIISLSYDIFAITIESKNIAASFESIFKTAWIAGEPT